MTLSIKHPLTAISPDNPAYEINPSNWNASHTIAGAASTQLVYGNVSGGLDQDSLLTWDVTNHALSTGAGSVTHPSVNFGTANTGLYSESAAIANLAANGAKIGKFSQTVLAFGLQSGLNASASGIFMGNPNVDAATANSIVLGSSTVTNLTNSVVIGYGSALDSTGVANDNNVLVGFGSSMSGITDSYLGGCFNSIVSPNTEFNTVSMVGNNNAVKIVAGGSLGMQMQALCNSVLYSNAGAGFGAPQFITIVGDSLNLPSYSTKSVAIIGSAGGGTTSQMVFSGDDGSAQLTGSLYPATDAKAAQTACALRAGNGAPNNANGNNGDVYFNSAGGALTTIYQKRAGAWVGIV
jgi:hypothetical protein